jgi:hypothetical protein
MPNEKDSVENSLLIMALREFAQKLASEFREELFSFADGFYLIGTSDGLLQGIPSETGSMYMKKSKQMSNFLRKLAEEAKAEAFRQADQVGTSAAIDSEGIPRG